MKGAHGANRTNAKIGQLTDVSHCNFQQYLFCNRRRGRKERNRPPAPSLPPRETFPGSRQVRPPVRNALPLVGQYRLTSTA